MKQVLKCAVSADVIRIYECGSIFSREQRRKSQVNLRDNERVFKLLSSLTYYCRLIPLSLLQVGTITDMEVWMRFKREKKFSFTADLIPFVEGSMVCPLWKIRDRCDNVKWDSEKIFFSAKIESLKVRTLSIYQNCKTLNIFQRGSKTQVWHFPPAFPPPSQPLLPPLCFSITDADKNCWIDKSHTGSTELLVISLPFKCSISNEDLAVCFGSLSQVLVCLLSRF